MDAEHNQTGKTFDDEGAVEEDKIFFDDSSNFENYCENFEYSIGRLFAELGTPNSHIWQEFRVDNNDSEVITNPEKLQMDNNAESGPSHQNDCGPTQGGLRPEQEATLDISSTSGSHSIQVEVLNKAGQSPLSSSDDGVFTAHPQPVTGVQRDDSSISIGRPLHSILSKNLALQSNVGDAQSTLLRQESVVNSSPTSLTREEHFRRYNSKPSSSQRENPPLDKIEGRQSAQKLFRCETCGKAFINKYWLQNHFRVHTCEKPCYYCEYCTQKFTYKSQLHRHMTTHTGEKPFHCEVCGKCYSDRSTLNHHRKKNHS